MESAVAQGVLGSPQKCPPLKLPSLLINHILDGSSNTICQSPCQCSECWCSLTTWHCLPIGDREFGEMKRGGSFGPCQPSLVNRVKASSEREQGEKDQVLDPQYLPLKDSNSAFGLFVWKVTG